MLRLMIVDDHLAARQGLRLRLGREPDLLVVGEAEDGASALMLARTLEPDVVLMDLALPDTDGIELASRLREVLPGGQCVILSLHDSRQNRGRAQMAGVSAFVGKQEPTEVLLSAIRRLGEARAS